MGPDDKELERFLNSVPQAQRLGAVQELKDAQLLAEEYEHSFALRYGGRPGVDQAGHQILKTVLKRLGRERARQAVEHYLTMHDEWFLKNGHSLDVFAKSITVVLASLYKKMKQEGTSIGLQLMNEVDRFVLYLFASKMNREAFGFTKKGSGTLSRPDLCVDITDAMVNIWAADLKAQQSDLMTSDVPRYFETWLAQYKIPPFDFPQSSAGRNPLGEAST